MTFESGMGLFVGFVVGILAGIIIQTNSNYTTCLERGHTIQECKEITR